MDTPFLHPLDLAETRADKPFKTTLFRTERVLAGLNTLLPGQSQPIHDHQDQDKFYYVLAGAGQFTVGDASRECTAGDMILAPAGVPHGVVNTGRDLLSVLTVIAPAPGHKD